MDSSMIGDKHKKYAARQTKTYLLVGRRFIPVQSIDMLDNYQLKKDTGGIV